MRSPPGLVSAAAIWLCANTAAAQVSGAIIAESARDFSRPHDVVLSPDGAFLYVADVGTDSIKVLDPSTLVTLGAFGADRLSGPHDVAFDQRGRLLVADTHNHRIAIYRVDGAAGESVDDIRGSLRTPEGVDVAADGTIYVTSASRHNVVKIRDGAIVADVGGGGGGLEMPPNSLKGHAFHFPLQAPFTTNFPTLCVGFHATRQPSARLACTISLNPIGR